jgi:hypothetical protein
MSASHLRVVPQSAFVLGTKETDGRSLAPGGGGPHNPDMELEKRVTKLEEAVIAIRLDLAEIKGKLSHMPTTWSLLVIVIGIVFTVMGGTLGIVRLLRP